MGGKVPTLPPKEQEKVHNLASLGLSKQIIATRMGVSRSAINRVLGVSGGLKKREPQ